MTIAEARSWVQDYSRNAGDTSEYSASRIDRAIQFVGSRFVRKTRCTRTTSTAALTSGSSAVSTTAISLFRPEYALRAWIAAQGELELTDHGELLERQIACDESGLPSLLAFTSTTAGEAYPTPDAAYTLSITWVEPFVTWTVGTGTPTFNLPDEWLKEILTYGVPAAMQHNEVEHLYASESWKKYLEFEKECTGFGGFGAKVLRRQSLRTRGIE